MSASAPSCPCGSRQPAAACCEPLLAGAPAPTALALMRSRYTAYVRHAVGYLLTTHDPDTVATVDRAALAAWVAATTWTGLVIVAARAGEPADATGEVEFIAHGHHRGRAFAQRERSRFRRVGGRWVYTDGVALPAAPPGPNDPCPCGSGAKYKRCHRG